MIAVVFNGVPAALESLQWTAADPGLQNALNIDAAAFQELDQETADPDPDRTHAKAMAEKWGGDIVGAEPPPDLGDKVY